MRKYWFYVKNHFRNLIKSLRFEIPWVRKTVLSKTKVCMLSIQLHFHDKIYWIRQNKILYFLEIYRFPCDHFFIGVVFFLYQWKILLKIKTFRSKKKNDTIWKKIVDLIKIFKFTSEHFLIGHVFFVLIVKKRYQKWEILFSTKSMRDTKKMSGKKIVCSKNIYKLASDYFYIRVISFHLFIKNVYMTITNHILPLKYTKCVQRILF